MLSKNRRGILLFIVLATIIIVTTLSITILRIVLSQRRLTHHQVTRVQAQYVAKAGMVYALEMLRTGVWTYSPNTCPSPAGCVVTDNAFPTTIVNRQFRVIFCAPGSTCPPALKACTPPAGSTFCVNSTAVFTYTP